MRILFGLALAGLMVGGCAHARHEAKSEYHEEKAERAWKDGRPVKAAKHGVKAAQEDAKAEKHERF